MNVPHKDLVNIISIVQRLQREGIPELPQPHNVWVVLNSVTSIIDELTEWRVFGRRVQDAVIDKERDGRLSR